MVPKPEGKKKWKLEIWQSGKITRDLCLSPDCSDREKGCWKVNRGIFVDGVKAVWHDDVISSKMRETMLVGGKLSSRSPHYEGSERDDSVEVVKRGLNPSDDVMEITPASVRTYPEYWQLLYKQADFRTQQLVAGEQSRSVPDVTDRQGPTDWNCALRCQLRYRQSAAGINCC